MTDSIDRYAVFGNPIKHSKSPLIHALFARQTGQRLIYTAEPAEADQFEAAVKNFLGQNGKGLNVTVPFKEEAWKLADRHSGRARRAGAVNTLKLEADGRLYGDTTDGVGLVRDLVHNHHIELAGKSVLIIGAGGAVRGVLEAILEQQPGSLLITNRTREKAVRLAKEFAALGNVSACGLNEIGAAGFDVIINGTSSSLKGDLPPLPATIFKEDGCSYDMMYGAEQTPFMRWSADNGAAKVYDGLGMLVEQAAESFYIWRGVKPETAPVIKQVRSSL